MTTTARSSASRIPSSIADAEAGVLGTDRSAGRACRRDRACRRHEPADAADHHRGFLHQHRQRAADAEPVPPGLCGRAAVLRPALRPHRPPARADRRPYGLCAGGLCLRGEHQHRHAGDGAAGAGPRRLCRAGARTRGGARSPDRPSRFADALLHHPGDEHRASGGADPRRVLPQYLRLVGGFRVPGRVRHGAAHRHGAAVPGISQEPRSRGVAPGAAPRQRARPSSATGIASDIRSSTASSSPACSPSSPARPTS